mmetsp:Transcript_3457/g.9855  ORF Transcript_3457/g.9855 Transcript_3457/m.9855 type:complete len:344 (+) Transcript_3457:4413-5444(+)
MEPSATEDDISANQQSADPKSLSGNFSSVSGSICARTTASKSVFTTSTMKSKLLFMDKAGSPDTSIRAFIRNWNGLPSYPMMARLSNNEPLVPLGSKISMGEPSVLTLKIVGSNALISIASRPTLGKEVAPVPKMLPGKESAPSSPDWRSVMGSIRIELIFGRPEDLSSTRSSVSTSRRINGGTSPYSSRSESKNLSKSMNLESSGMTGRSQLADSMSVSAKPFNSLRTGSSNTWSAPARNLLMYVANKSSMNALTIRSESLSRPVNTGLSMLPMVARNWVISNCSVAVRKHGRISLVLKKEPTSKFPNASLSKARKMKAVASMSCRAKFAVNSFVTDVSRFL